MIVLRIFAIILLGLLVVTIACNSQVITPVVPERSPTSQEQPSAPATDSVPKQTPNTQQADELELQIVSVTSPVSPGSNATLVAQTTPGAQCNITVHYKSGASKASGLYSKTADNSGKVSWTWKVGTRTTPGSWQIVVKVSNDGQTVSQSTDFIVR